MSRTETEFPHEAPGILHPTERDWEETLAATPGVMIVDFWAPWCGPCRAIAPVLEDVVRTSGGTVTLAKVNVDEQPGLAARFGVHSIPTLLFVNLDGDGQADLKGHGGIYKAVYAYSIENYDYWKRELRRDDFSYGQFGENFTVEGMLEDGVHLGDVFRVGGALVTVSEPRVPCAKLALKMDLPTFPKRFLASERVGFYLQVLQEGEVCAGDPIERVKADPERMTVREFLHLAYFDEGDLEGVRKALRITTLPPDWREWLEGVLAKSGEAPREKGDCCS